MAKAAKSVQPEISEQRSKKFVAEVMERLDNIASARGKFMNAARQEREGIVAQHEMMAAHGISQKISKLIIKIAVTTEKVRGWQSELDDAERKLAIKLTKAIGDRRQMSLWNDLPTTPKGGATLSVVPQEEPTTAIN